MRVAFIGPKGIPAIFGGVEAHVDSLASLLTRRGHDVTVYVRTWYTPEEQHCHNSIRLIHTPTIQTKHLDAAVHSLTSSLHSLFQKFDIIHYHAIGPACFCWLPALVQKKIIVTVHSLDWQRGKWGPLAKTILKIAERIAITIPAETIAVSRNLQTYYTAKYHKKVTYIPNGTHLRKKEVPEIIAMKYRLKVNGYILFMGRFVPEKRVEWLIDAFKAVTAQCHKGDLKLVLAGGSSATDGYVQHVQRRIGGADDIIFTGFVTGKEKDELFSNANCFILPSSVEGNPIALLEAMSFGIPCLVSDIPAHQELITDGVNGILFKCHHFADLVDRLRSLLSDNPVKLNALGEKGRQYVKVNHDWNTIAVKTEEVYYSASPWY